MNDNTNLTNFDFNNFTFVCLTICLIRKTVKINYEILETIAFLLKMIKNYLFMICFLSVSLVKLHRFQLCFLEKYVCYKQNKAIEDQSNISLNFIFNNFETVCQFWSVPTEL